ncbi:MAG TPA: hypothetical protein VEL05_04290, partial [Candidatus Acidoferrum sp.]|nr:hypothetical protein [Candidatus Acidoferrum sp.]
GPVSPDELYVEHIFPDQVFEGQGSAAIAADEPLVRALPMVLFGQNMTPDTRITVSGEGIATQDVDAEVSQDGRWAAFALRLPVIEDGRAATDVDLVVDLVKEDETPRKRAVHHLLEEIVGDQDGTLDTDRLATDDAGIARYSRIELNGSIAAVGSMPLRLVGYAGISVSGILSASGNGSAPGAGGCAGGEPNTDASCGEGSGRLGGNGVLGLLRAGGGGGGAFGANDAGEGGGPPEKRGAPGAATGVPSLVPMPPATGSVRGAGGGGGGKPPDVAGHGGSGGGSGGAVEITTPAVLDLSGFVSADGADGGTCDLGGGGGGGSGGAVLLRAGAGARIPPGNARVAARGGDGGACSESPGGQGGSGLIRVDLPDPFAAGGADPEAVFIGPAFITSAVPVVTTDPVLQVTIRGKPGSSYVLERTSPDGEGEDRPSTQPVSTPEPEGIGEEEVQLREGLNQLCVEVANEDPDLYPEAANCITVAYIRR